MSMLRGKRSMWRLAFAGFAAASVSAILAAAVTTHAQAPQTAARRPPQGFIGGV